jgi:uncharacterized membrane protein
MKMIIMMIVMVMHGYIMILIENMNTANDDNQSWTIIFKDL